jgi:hypothetical protein
MRVEPVGAVNGPPVVDIEPTDELALSLPISNFSSLAGQRSRHKRGISR